MKKWHLSAHAPQRTQMSMNREKDRNFSRRSFMPLRTVSFHLSGSPQSLSSTAQGWGLGNFMYSMFFLAAG